MLKEESIIDCMAHYIALYDANKSNDREKVLKNTYALNELLHKKDIDEVTRSQFVGTVLLHIKSLHNKLGNPPINTDFSRKNCKYK